MGASGCRPGAAHEANLSSTPLVKTSLRQHPGADAGAAEGADLRAHRRGDVAHSHQEGQPSLPLLRQPGRAEAGIGCVSGRRVPAAEIEGAVIDQLRGIFRQPEIIVGTWRAARGEQGDLTEDEAREALTQLGPLWDELFPAEQARIVQLLVERVDVRTHGVEVRLRRTGSPRWCGKSRATGGRRREAGNSLGRRGDITVHIPLTFRKRGGGSWW